MLKRVGRLLELAETTLLVGLLTTMLGVAGYQIIARNFFGTGLAWGEDLVQIALLWVTMVGATAAAGAGSHIKIDLIAKFAPPRLRLAAKRLTTLFTALVCAALGWYSIEFIRWDFVDKAVGFGAVPAWICEAIIPLAASVMAARYLIRALVPSLDEAS